MKEVYRTNEPVILSAIESALEEAGLYCLIADQFTSMMEGSIGAIQRRVLVLDDEEDAARDIIDSLKKNAND